MSNVRQVRGIFGAQRSRPSLMDQYNRPAPLWAKAQTESGFVIGRRLRGESALPMAGNFALISPDRLCRHVILFGATGSGKTETALRLAYAAAATGDAQVLYLDGKGDRQTAQRFCGLMELAGRQAVVFPHRPFDGWRGEPHEIQGRLLEIVDYSSEGPAAWYRDIAKTTLSLVCFHPEGPPRSSGQALSRMDLAALRAAHPGSSALRALTAEHVGQVRLRYEAHFAHTRGLLDGDWAWDDVDSAYVLLDTMALKEEARSLARFLFEDFAHYFTTRKPRERLCLMIVDEFSALAQGTGMAGRVEQARGYRTALVLAPQAIAGMGDESEAARITASAETIICHRTNDPDSIAKLAGTHRALEYSTQFDYEGATGRGTGRMQHQLKVDPNEVRQLAAGEAFVIARGLAMKLRVQRAPQTAGHLPAIQSPKHPLAPGPKRAIDVGY